MFCPLEDHVDWFLGGLVVNFILSKYLDRTLFIGPSSFISDKLPKVIALNKLFELVFQGIVVFDVMSMVSVESLIFTFILGGRRRLHQWGPSKEPFSFNLHEDVCSRSEERGVVKIFGFLNFTLC